MISKDLELKIDAFIAENKENILKDIATLIEIPSVSVDGPAEAPFGEGCKKALDAALAICEGMGMATKNYDYYAGSASIGDKEKEISIMGHLDVVPEGNGWTVDPYKMTIKDGYIYGRGVADDKGPAVLGLYAMKYLKENNIPLNYTYRLMLGCSEERGMGDVEIIKQREKIPTFMFTPDADFPVINGEKGIMSAEARFAHDGAHIVKFFGGSVSNMVADRCTVALKGISKENLGELCSCKFDVENCECGCLKVTAKGVGSHAAAPDGSINAIGMLCEMLSKVEALSEAERSACAKAAATLADHNGVGLGIDCEDEQSGKITHISGVAEMEENEIVLNYNIRYPVTAKGDELKARLEAYAAAHGFAGKVLSDSAPSYRSVDTKEVQALLSAYNEVTGKEAKAKVIGGGTYARNFPNAVAFGPEFPEMPNPAGEGKGGVHMADECTSIDYMMLAVKIYIVALLKLNELEL
ncbi:MAG: Sapep family Mn(2+)-dependent dipeptidase [Oscillospiraceae bacterium]|nr:Sapep family Mn(2+)-dependent dipeptidase [Oscillospiraceae bacterium]